MKKFTLIELLVVIAIIGILSSILLPSLSKAREKGLSAVCKNNLKQQSIAMHLYTDEEDVFPSLTIPNSVTGNPVAWTWQKRLYIDLAQDGTPLKCPSDKNFAFGWEVSYGFNYWYLQEINPSLVQDPTETVLTADSGHVGETHVWNTRPAGAAGYIINNKAGWAAPIHPRHLDAGNILWVDGHVSGTSQMILIHATNDKWDLE